MDNPIITALGKLIDVKSLVTIALTIGFIVQSVRGHLTNEFTSVYLVVISFYFGTQYQKKTEGETDVLTQYSVGPSEQSEFQSKSEKIVSN